MNIRGLKLTSDRSKPEHLADIMNIENSIGIGLTETWLNPNILDAEVMIDGFTLFRCDRLQRNRGGGCNVFEGVSSLYESSGTLKWCG